VARPPSVHPTDVELEILKILWDGGPAELGGVCAALRSRRPVANTTVATMLKVMLDKGLVARDRGPRGYQWSAIVSRKAATTGLLGKLLDRAFDGSARRLVAHLIETDRLDDDERDAIRHLLDQGRPAADGSTR